MTGQAQLLSDILKDRISRGERSIVEREFLELSKKRMFKNARYNPLEIDYMMSIYSEALGYPGISGLGIV